MSEPVNISQSSPVYEGGGPRSGGGDGSDPGSAGTVANPLGKSSSVTGALHPFPRKRAGEDFSRPPTRDAGLVACLIGVLVMVAGRFVHGVPAVLIYVGVSIIVFGWGLLALSRFRVKS